MQRAATNPTHHPIVAAIVSVALVLEGLLVPLHLTWYEHEHPGQTSDHAHLHADHGHAHHAHVRVEHAADGHWHGPEHWSPVDSGREHRPHPAEDHPDRSTETAPAGSHGPSYAALPLCTNGLPYAFSPPRPHVALPIHEPRPPPTPSARASRAPPIVV